MLGSIDLSLVAKDAFSVACQHLPYGFDATHVFKMIQSNRKNLSRGAPKAEQVGSMVAAASLASIKLKSSLYQEGVMSDVGQFSSFAWASYVVEHVTGVGSAHALLQWVADEVVCMPYGCISSALLILMYLLPSLRWSESQSRLQIMLSYSVKRQFDIMQHSVSATTDFHFLNAVVKWQFLNFQGIY